MKSIRFLIVLATFMVPIFATTAVGQVAVDQVIDSCATIDSCLVIDSCDLQEVKINKIYAYSGSNVNSHTDTIAIIYVIRTQEAYLQRDVVRAYTQISIEELYSVIGEFFYINMSWSGEPVTVTQKAPGDYIRE